MTLLVRPTPVTIGVVTEVQQPRSKALVDGREAFDRQDWAVAYALLAAAGASEPLDAVDLERFAVVAQLLARDDDGLSVWEQAHHAALAQGDVPRAIRCAFWLTLGSMNRGQAARGAGWLARGTRLLESNDLDRVERGYMLVITALRSLDAGDADQAMVMFSRAVEIADRFEDADLAALARLGRGQSSIGSGDVPGGLPLLDEVMVAVTAGEVSPLVVGIVYCGVIESCHKICDLERASEWTAALTRWCASNRDVVPFKGECLVYRSEIMRFQGVWQDAMDAAEQARDSLVQSPATPAFGAALYQIAELHRLRGGFTLAEAGYRRAHQHGHGPQPGLALLRLAQGRLDAASTALRGSPGDVSGPTERSRLLPACVEIELATDNVAAARSHADELSVLASESAVPLQRANACYALGTVLMAEGEPLAALGPLREARAVWQQNEVPYEVARARVQIGMACRALDDEDAATMEFDAALQVFRELGATPDLARLARMAGAAQTRIAIGLTRREIEVLHLIADGKSNRAIATDLVISDKTVARHVSNILMKLDVPSRSAATAYAYRNALLERG